MKGSPANADHDLIWRGLRDRLAEGLETFDAVAGDEAVDGLVRHFCEMRGADNIRRRLECGMTSYDC